ncbi:MAG: nucleotide sugar dehydrogenase [Aigarchaeota archaeon]|nr:nucleotide sugar dehydrogenase [Aigarchaeota archaeon]MDW8093046.1 nucleotide sugar dehydrogenase [Nitrososphaerota archaeon]
MNVSRISIVGLGKLGLCIATVLAHRGYKVIGVDIDDKKVEEINKGRSPIYEPKLDRLLRMNRKRLRAVTDYGEAISNTGVTFVVVPTPSDPDGSFSSKYVVEAMSEIGKVLSTKRNYHLVALNSTVMPGSMDTIVRPTLEEYSGRRTGKNLGLCYNPEFIALGDVINGLLRPDFVLIGESDERAGNLLSSIYKKVCTNNPPIERTNFINAEIAKIAINSFITMKITFANTLAEICERVPKANVDEVTRILGKDSRIGPRYLRGGLGYGGPCFPRDNIAFVRFAESIGGQAELAMTTHRVNTVQPERIVRMIEEVTKSNNKKIGILGLSYKPNTPVIDESQSLHLAMELRRKGYEVHVYDPLALENAKNVLKDSVVYERSKEECVRNCDIIVIATPWTEFKTINGKGKVIVDCWRILDKNSVAKGSVTYIPLGVNEADR